MARKPIDMSNQRFGRLFVESRTISEYDKHGVKWNCLCDCGNRVSVYGHHLRQGLTQSCGCYHKEVMAEKNKHFSTTHGLYESPEYNSWQAMKARCTNPNHIAYERYGGRGIEISSSWLNSFEEFYSDMGPKPGPDYTLERINNDLGYYNSNCRWATKSEQANNRISNVYYEYNGIKLSIAQLCRELNVTRDVFLTAVSKSPTLCGKIKKIS